MASVAPLSELLDSLARTFARAALDAYLNAEAAGSDLDLSGEAEPEASSRQSVPLNVEGRTA
jgi:hypothetical protein